VGCEWEENSAARVKRRAVFELWVPLARVRGTRDGVERFRFSVLFQSDFSA